MTGRAAWGGAAVTAWTVAVALCACSGGAGAPPSGATAGGGMRTAHLTITIPARSSTSAHRRAPAYISPATQSLVIAALYGSATPGPALVADVSRTSAACTTAADGTRTCTVTVAVLPGATQFDVSGYDGPSGDGPLLEHALAALPGVTSPVVDIDVVLGGDIAALTLALTGGQFTLGVPGTRTLQITAKDADGFVIGGTNAYDVPVTLTPSDAGITVSPATIAGAGQSAVLFYNGDPNAATSITASVAGVSAATVAIRAVGAGAATPVPVSTHSPNPGVTAILIVH